MVRRRSPRPSSGATAAASARAVLHVADLGRVSARRDRVGDEPTGDARKRRLPGGVDVGHDDHVDAVERARELAGEGRGPRVAVRLEDRHDAVPAPGPRRRDHGGDLAGEVCVVVDERGAAELASELEAARHAGEPCERLDDGAVRDPAHERDGGGDRGVLHVVRTRRADANGRAPRVGAQREPRGRALERARRPRPGRTTGRCRRGTRRRAVRARRRSGRRRSRRSSTTAPSATRRPRAGRRACRSGRGGPPRRSSRRRARGRAVRRCRSSRRPRRRARGRRRAARSRRGRRRPRRRATTATVPRSPR